MAVGTEQLLSASAGAIPDAELLGFVTIAAGSNALTSTDEDGNPVDRFGAEDVGKAIVIAGAGAGGAKLVSTISAYVSPSQVALADAAPTATAGKGAAFGTDCGPALKNALTGLDSAGGGSLVVDGLYLLTSEVTHLFIQARVTRIRNGGSDSGFIVAQGPGATAITLENPSNLVIEGISFAGMPGEPNDARRVLQINGGRAHIQECYFLGFANISERGAAVLWADGCELSLERNYFGGNALASGLDNSCVEIRNFVGFSSTRDRFIDYGDIRGVYLSKTGLVFCRAWIHVRDQFREPSNATNQSVVRITDSRFDEGHVYALLVDTTRDSGKRISRVHVDGGQFNNTLITDGSAIQISNADHVTIERTSIGWAQTPHNALWFINCRNVEASRISLKGTAATGLVGENVANLTLRDCPDFTSFNLVNVANFQRHEGELAGRVAKTKVGRVTDADFDAPPPVGTLAIDSFAKRLFAKLSPVEGWFVGEAMVPAFNTSPAVVNLANTNVTDIGGGVLRIVKSGGASGVRDAAAVGTNIYAGDFLLRAQVSSQGANLFAGMTPDPRASVDFQSIAYAFYFADYRLYIYENGTQVSGPSIYNHGATINRAFIRRTGSTLRYLLGTSDDINAATLLRTVANVTAKLSFDSSFETLPGASLDVRLS